jgi:hypothetical protein
MVRDRSLGNISSRTLYRVRLEVTSRNSLLLVRLLKLAGSLGESKRRRLK